MGTRVYSRKKTKLIIDQISRLPDELLVSILSCLSLKEAVASSIICRRWRYLWTYISKLDFDGFDFWKSFTFPSKPDFDNYDFYTSGKHDAIIRECREYVGWVDNVLRLRGKSAAVEELRISFGLTESHQSYIDGWIKFALDTNVVRLDLNLVMTVQKPKLYTFPYKLLCDNESHSWGFKGLRLIRMAYLNVSDGVLEIFLRSCPLLEEIFIAKCEGFSTVKIVNPLPSLKRLTIIYCLHFESIEVCDSNLVYFMYRGPTLKHFLLKNVPLLVEMNVGGIDSMKVENFLTMFSSHLPQLEKLTIETRRKLTIMEARLICSSVKMSNLKQFVWKFVGLYRGDSSLMPLTILVGALPLLQRLVLLSYGDRKKAVAEVGVSHHHLLKRRTFTYSSHLKQVEFVGYHGEANEFEILADIIENAAALEEVIIHPPKLTGVYCKYTEEDMDAFRACAKAQLTTTLPSTATLKIL